MCPAQYGCWWARARRSSERVAAASQRGPWVWSVHMRSTCMHHACFIGSCSGNCWQLQLHPQCVLSAADCNKSRLSADLRRCGCVVFGQAYPRVQMLNMECVLSAGVDKECLPAEISHSLKATGCSRPLRHSHQAFWQQHTCTSSRPQCSPCCTCHCQHQHAQQQGSRSASRCGPHPPELP